MNANVKILIVEDTETHRRLIKRVLKSQGYGIIEAESCDQALEILQTGVTPHLVILDHMMPKQTGAAFWESIQYNAKYQHVHGVPAVFITAYPEDDDVKKLKEKGVPVLSKPLSDYLEIQSIVSSVLGKRKSASDEIVDAITKAKVEEKRENWVNALQHYNHTNKLIEKLARKSYSGNVGKLPEHIKDQAIECWVGYLRCQFFLRSRVSSSMLIWDFPNVEGLDSIEQRLSSYKTKYPIKLWNELHQTYNELEIECQDKRMPRTAEVFHRYSIKASRNLYYSLALRGGADKSRSERFRAFVNALRASVELALDRATIGIFWSILSSIGLILLFAFLYYRTNGIRFENGLSLPSGTRGLLYAFYFSVFIFMGSEPGALTTNGQAIITLLMVLESILAFIFTAVVIGYVVNRLSSR